MALDNPGRFIGHQKETNQATKQPWSLVYIYSYICIYIYIYIYISYLPYSEYWQENLKYHVNVYKNSQETSIQKNVDTNIQ